MDVFNIITTNPYSKLVPYRGKAGEDISTVYYCPKGHRITFHKSYIQANVTGCIRNGCGKSEVLTEKLCQFRGWTFIRYFKGKNGKNQPKFQFICDKGHEQKMKFENLRLGSNCKICEKEQSGIIHSSCNCEVKEIGFRNPNSSSWICDHYNHGVLFPDSTLEWDYNNLLNNGITAYMIEPLSGRKFWFKCKFCKMPYDQQLSKRVRGDRCPYCRGLKVCEWNSVATLYPHLLEEWDSKNSFKLSDVPRCSTLIGLWFCNKHKENLEDETFRWSAVIYSRTNKDEPSGCPKCNKHNYDQEVGGKEYFVKISNEIHKNKYEYLGEYVNDKTKIAILCKDHGIFHQTPNGHKTGRGCKRCADKQKDSKGVIKLKEIFHILNINYKCEETFEGLRYKLDLWIDFYIPDFNLCVEYDGEQHFRHNKLWGGEKEFLKNVYCVKNGLNFLRIPYNVKPTKELISYVLDLCKSGQQYYMSYPEFIQNTIETLGETNVDFSKIVNIPINMP
jgi:very-short-patch-repair endonuclease